MKHQVGQGGHNLMEIPSSEAAGLDYENPHLKFFDNKALTAVLVYREPRLSAYL